MHSICLSSSSYEPSSSKTHPMLPYFQPGAFLSSTGHLKRLAQVNCFWSDKLPHGARRCCARLFSRSHVECFVLQLTCFAPNNPLRTTPGQSTSISILLICRLTFSKLLKKMALMTQLLSTLTPRPRYEPTPENRMGGRSALPVPADSKDFW